MSRLSAIAAVLVALCTIGLVTGCSVSVQSGQYTKSYPVGARPSVRIHAYDARVHVVPSEDPKVEFNVQYEDLDGSVAPFSSHQDGSVIDLTASEPPSAEFNWARFMTRRVTIEVRMPKDADLAVETSNGAIRVSGLKGRLKLHTSNGGIDADEVDGSVELFTSNGHVHAAGRFDSLDIRSSNGGVVARAESGSDVSSGLHINTSNAGVELSVPTDLKANLDIGTSNGGVRFDLPVTAQDYAGKSHVRGTVNGGGPEVTVHTSNGGIHIGAV